MVSLVHVYTHLMDRPDDKNRQYFYAKFSGLNFNDTTITSTWDGTPVLHGGRTKLIYISRIALFVVSAPSTIVFGAPGVKFVWIPTADTPLYSQHYAPLPAWTTDGTSPDAHVWEVEAPFDISYAPDINAGGPFYCTTVSGYAATDDVYLSVWGWLEWENPETVSSAASRLPNPQPVSLEGYKWPLTRR